MKYPTLEQVEAADYIQLGRWMRFLDSPGMSAIGDVNMERTRIIEAHILDRISERFYELGGWTPGISKAIGWDKPK